MNLSNKIETLFQDSIPAANKVLFYGCGMLLLLVLVQLFSIFGEPQVWQAWFSVIIYLAFVVLTYKHTPIFFWLFFLFFFVQGTAIISCVFLESGNYISEQAAFGYATGATSRLVMYNLIFYLSGLYFFSIYTKKHPVTPAKPAGMSKGMVVTICLGLSALITVLFVGLYQFGVPLFQGLDRYTYWINHPMPIFRTLSGQLYFFVFLLGLIYSFTKRRIILLIFVAVVGYLILQSVKFSSLFLVGYLFLLPVIIINLSYGKVGFALKKVLLYGLIALTIFISVLTYHYSTIQFSAESSVAESIVSRALGLQGHVWWGTDKEVLARNNALNFDQISNEVSAFMSLSSETDEVGMKHLISLVAPPHIAEAYLERGVNFTMGYPAIGLQLFGYIGLLFLQIIVAAIVVAVSKYVYHKIVNFQLIRAAVAIKLFIEIYGAFTMGNFYQLISTKVVFYLFLIILLESAVYLGRRRELA